MPRVNHGLSQHPALGHISCCSKSLRCLDDNIPELAQQNRWFTPGALKCRQFCLGLNVLICQGQLQGSQGPRGRAPGPLKIQWGPCEILPEDPMDPQNWRIGNCISMKGPFKFCLEPLEIQMVGAPNPQQKMSTESPAGPLSLCRWPFGLMITLGCASLRVSCGGVWPRFGTVSCNGRYFTLAALFWTRNLLATRATESERSWHWERRGKIFQSHQSCMLEKYLL